MKNLKAMESTEISDNNADDIGQMKENKQEVENKVARILKLIKNNGQDKKGKIPEDWRRKSELIGLVNDFHKKYQSLYEQYDNLRREMGKRAYGRKEKENSSSAPTSDSEYYSSEEIENGVLHNKSSDSDIETSEESNLKYMTAFGKSPRAETIRKDHKNKAHDRKREFSTLVKVQEVHGSQASAEIKELEGQLTMLRMELESLRSAKHDLEVQNEEKETEAKRLGETNVQLRARISEIELISEEKRNEISAMTVKMKENENNLTSRIQVLVTQVKDLQLEIDYLRAEIAEKDGSKKNKKSAQVKGLKDQFKNMQEELESLRQEKTELELQLNMKTKETAEKLSQIEGMKEELATKNSQVQVLLEEKEGFLVQIDDLKLDGNFLRDQKNELEEIIRSKNKEKDELREEKGSLQEKILELERNLVDKENELSTVENEKREGEEHETSTQMMALKKQINRLQQELDSLVGEKLKLEEQNDRLKQDSAHNQMQVENEILNLTSKIEDQQKSLKEKDDTIKKFTEEDKLIKQHSLESPQQRSTTDSPKYRSADSAKFSQNVFERKIDELAEKFQMKMENHIRLLSRRIRVAEQLHTETKESYKKATEKIEQENKELMGKKAEYESEMKKMKDILSKSGSNMLTGLNIMIKKIDEENGKFLNRISRISNELQVTRNYVSGNNNDIRKLKQNMEEEEEVSDRDRELGEDKLMNDGSKLERKVEDLEQKLKEKDDVLSILGEEKKEAIRQLCVLIEYHRQRYDHLKEAVSKIPIRFRKPT